MKKLLIILICSIGISIGFAQTNMKKHEVQIGQTAYTIAKFYNMSLEDLRKYNPELNEDFSLSPGQVLHVIKKPKRKPVQDTLSQSATYKYHIVQAQETLYSVSKLYPDLTVKDLMAMNKLEAIDIKTGDTLIVQKVKKEALYQKKPDTLAIADTLFITDTVKNNNEKMNDSRLYQMLFESYASDGYDLKKNKGIADFTEHGESEEYMAMVNDVAIGNIIRVRNLLNNRVVYLKVIGKLPKGQKNVSLIISKSAAEDLMIVEERFVGEWSYYVK